MQLARRQATSRAADVTGDASRRGLPPVFIVAPSGKSGTNFLYHALQAIGVCEPAARSCLKAEDHLACHSDLLLKYVQTTASAWRNHNENHIVDHEAHQLLYLIGEALSSFIGMPLSPEKRIVLKTPNSSGLGNLFDLMPGASLIVLVRDGRDVAESQVRAGYATDYETVFKNWAVKARHILDFMRDHEHRRGESWQLVRFEEMIQHSEATFVQIARFLGRQALPIDVEAIQKLPLYGSIEGADDGFVWTVKAKPAGFDPIGRWRCWNETRCSLFKELAGDELIELGYERDPNWSSVTPAGATDRSCTDQR